MTSNFSVFLLDVDGVLTSGHFIYSNTGKKYKIFGPDDNDALHLIERYVPVRFITGDKKGFQISKRRIVDDMGFRLDFVSTTKRLNWIESHYDLDTVIYMGDGIFDHLVLSNVAYGIAPANADPSAITAARYVTQRFGGDRAVAEAVVHLLQKFFKPFDISDSPSDGGDIAGG